MFVRNMKKNKVEKSNFLIYIDKNGEKRKFLKEKQNFDVEYRD